jgi:hypothetical protein
MSVIPVVQELEVRRMVVQGQPRQISKLNETPISTNKQGMVV